MLVNKKIIGILTGCVVLFVMLSTQTSCGVYKFKDISIPDTIHTVKINYIENRASYVNPQLSPTLTDKLKQKITNQTRLTQTNGDNADWEVTATITDYSVSFAAISNQTTTTSRLTVGVQVNVFDRKANEDHQPFTVSKTFDFSASKTLQQAENELKDQIINNLTDEIFNRIFSNW